MSKGLGKVESAIIEAIKGFQCKVKPLDDVLEKAYGALSMPDDTQARRATISRALNTLTVKGLINTYWTWNDVISKRQRCIDLRCRERIEKTPEEIFNKASSDITSRLASLGELRRSDMITPQMLKHNATGLYSWRDSINELIALMENNIVCKV